MGRAPLSTETGDESVWEGVPWSPEQILPGQQGQATRHPGLCRLAFALVEDAIRVLEYGPDGAARGQAQSHAEALRWMQSDDDEYLLSFVGCCEIMGLPAQRLRRGILQALAVQSDQRLMPRRGLRPARLARIRLTIVTYRHRIGLRAAREGSEAVAVGE